MSGPTPPPGALVSDLDEVGPALVVLSFPLPTRADELARLTAAERAVALLAIEGHSNREIAEIRGTSLRTVANQIASVLRKLGVGSRHELAVRFARLARADG